MYYGDGENFDLPCCEGPSFSGGCCDMVFNLSSDPAGMTIKPSIEETYNHISFELKIFESNNPADSNLKIDDMELRITTFTYSGDTDNCTPQLGSLMFNGAPLEGVNLILTLDEP